MYRRWFIVLLSIMILTGCDSDISYHGRDYKPSEVGYSSIKEVEERCKCGPLKPTGKYIKNMEVYDTDGIIPTELVPTVLILKKANGSFATYELRGGP